LLAKAGAPDTARRRAKQQILQSFYKRWSSGPLKWRQQWHLSPVTQGFAPMLDWPSNLYNLFGESGRNWVILIGAGIVIYVATLVISRHNHRTL
jgi:hypothetical protein